MSGTEVIGRVVRKGRAAGRRRPLGGLPAAVARVIAGVVLLGLAAGALVALAPATATRVPEVRLSWLHGVALIAALVLLTCVSELVAVRLRRQDASEELTLLDPMILLNVLLLAPREALSASLAGIALAYLIRRRTPVKAVFNLGTYATAASLMIVLVRVTAGNQTDFDVQLVAALLLGAAGFVAVNVGAMSLLFAAMGAGRLWDLIREDARSAAFTLIATVALTATGVSIAAHTPVLLPVVVLPAAAITYAYRATATEAEERDRSARVLAFSQVLASSPERDVAVTAFLRLALEGFYADEVLAVMEGGSVLELTPADGAEPRAVAPTDRHQRLAGRAAGGAAVLVDGLPAGWSGALVAPLEAGGGRMGTVVIGRCGRARFTPQDLSVLTPIASALGAALRNGEHLAQLVEESSKLRAVVDQSSDGILVLDSSGVVQVWNPALERLSGWSEEDALGARLGDLFETQDLDGNTVDAFEAGLQGLSPVVRQVAVDLTLIRKDGERRSVRCIHAATFDAFGLVRDVVNVHDLTRQRQVEKLKSDFVATVSHELRTPVTPIKGYADLLRRKGESMTPEKRAKALDVICDRAAHLARLVEDLLLASNVSTEKEPARSVVIESADLAQLATRATEDFAPAAGRLRLHVPAEPVAVACDPVRTVQVLTNLVSNALKYSPEDSPVDVEVGVDAGGRGRVTVVDRGRGLPADQLEQIFEKFHRVEDPMVMSTSGTGLGLYIARHLARAMSGDLEVTSTLGQGSTFTFHLPLATPPPG